MSNAALNPDPYAPKLPPGMADLPYEDDEHMETPKHRQQMTLLIETLRRHLSDRPDVYIGGNMGVYYSALQARNLDFRAPDFFVVLDTEPGERLSWVIWEEERAPDLVIELLSSSTAAADRGRKKTIYAKAMKVQEYYLFDPHELTLEGFTLDGETLTYGPIEAGADGGLGSRVLGLRLVVARGEFQGVTTEWLRWALPDGTILPTGFELAEAERTRAERLAEKLRAAGIDPTE